MIKNNPLKLLTISIAAYNAEKYLDDCISSLVNVQNIECLDIIIVNDGSTDSTMEISKKYTALYPNSIRVIDKSNAGWGSTINSSINIAEGKYFKPLDADDMFETKNIDDLIVFLGKAEADIIISPYKTLYKNDISNYKISTNTIEMHKYIFKTSLFKDNNIFITENCYYTDIELTLKCIKYAKTYDNYNNIIYLYRVGNDGQSVSDVNLVRNIDQHFNILSNIILHVYNDLNDPNIKNITFERIVEMINRHYSIIFKIKPLINSKKLAKSFDIWLKDANIELYNSIKIFRVKVLREFDYMYGIVYYILKFRSCIYNFLKRL